MKEIFLSPYNPKDTEEKIYKVWEESGFFNPDVCVGKGLTEKDAEYFSIILPPPNATGVLHLGHALEDSMQDTMIRYNRMKGKKTLWLPGTDHAAIATDSKVTKMLEKEGLSKKEIGREKFLERVNEFVENSRKTIVSQLRKIGASLDWSREAFTLDKFRNVAVKTAFKKMYDDGLIYRGSRIVNWDPRGQTVISDDEIVYEEKKNKHGIDTYKHISELLEEAKILHKKDWSKNPTANGDHEQSWRAFKGKNLEKLIVHIISDEVKALGLKIVDGNALERTKEENFGSKNKRRKS